MHGSSIGSETHDKATWIGRSHVKGKGWVRMVLVTCNLLGMQLVWSTEMGMAAPYLLSLGVSKSLLAAILLAGPVSGLVVQPIVGSLSDNCKLPLGRRRPFIIGGTAVCALSLIIFGWAKQVASIVSSPGGRVHHNLAIWLAALSVWVIDFSVNVVQAADRALLVDVLPASEQAEVNAWAGRLTAIGAIAGFGIADLNLPRYFGLLGGTQIQILAILVSFFFVATHLVTCWAVTERVLLSNGIVSRATTPASVFRELWFSFRRLPDPIWLVYRIQCFLWVGWFAVMFYSTTWVSELYLEGRSLNSVGSGVAEAAERAGSHAMLLHAVLNLVTTVFAPMIINIASMHESNSSSRRALYELPAETFVERITESLRPLIDRCRPFLPRLPIEWLTLSQAWFFANSLFSVLLLATYFVHDAAGATAIIALTGFCWAFTAWVPFTLLGELILQTGTTKHRLNSSTTSIEDLSAESFVLAPSEEQESDDEESKDVRNGSQILELHHADDDGEVRQPLAEDAELGGIPSKEEAIVADSAGTVIGLHNIFVVIPQLSISFLSTFIFAGLSPGDSVPPEGASRLRRRADGSSDYDSIGLIFRLGGFAAIYSAWLSWRMVREEWDAKTRRRSRGLR